MIRWLVVFAAMLVGCVASVPSDHTLTADLACESSRALVQLRRSPAPTPRPDDGRCGNCNGRGTVGDGRVAVKCPVCDGTGKNPKPAAVTPICTTGTCRP